MRTERGLGLLLGVVLATSAAGGAGSGRGPSGAFTGVVTDPDGAPVAGASVALAGGRARATTAADGSFALDGVPAGAGPQTVLATLELDAARLYGIAGGVEAAAGRVVDVGAIALRPFECAFDPSGGAPLSTDEDVAVRVAFGQGFRFPFHGALYDEVYVGSNGYLTFTQGDDTAALIFTEQIVEGLPRIAPGFVDLSPPGGGRWTYRQEPDRFLVTWRGVPEFGVLSQYNGGMTFQAVLFDDGRVHFVYDGLARLIPLSSGLAVTLTPGGTPARVDVDYSAARAASTGAGEALYEHFTPFGNRLDLDGRCMEWTPNARGGYDVFVAPLL